MQALNYWGWLTQAVFADGVAELDTRYAIETEAGHTIEVKNFGYRHGAPEVIAALARGRILIPRHMRTHTSAWLSGDPDLARINRTLFVGTGARLADQVIMTLFAIASELIQIRHLRCRIWCRISGHSN